MNSNAARKKMPHRGRFARPALLALALASGTALAAGGGHGGGFGGGHFGGGHFGGPGVSHFGGPGDGHFGAPHDFHGFNHFEHRGFVGGGAIIVPYPYGYYGPGYPYPPYCNPYTPYYDPLYC